MSSQCEIRLTGSGGQGLILAGIILAESALIDGNNAIQSQSYGPEARGGASKAEVIISNKEINYPKVRDCDILLALTQVSCDTYIRTLKKDGILIIDSGVDTPKRDDIKIYSVPILHTASEKLQKSLVANIVALGAINKLAEIVSSDALEKSVLNRVPKGTEEFNQNALKEGIMLIENYGE